MGIHPPNLCTDFTVSPPNAVRRSSLLPIFSRVIAVGVFLVLLFLGVSYPSTADGVFTDDFVATRDGVPVQRLAHRRDCGPCPRLLGLAYDPEDRLLYILDESGGFTLDIDTGKLIGYVGPVFLHDSAGLAFDPVQRCLYLLAPDDLWLQLDPTFRLQSVELTPFFVGHAGLAYDSGLDAFWAFSSASPNLLRLLDRNAQILQEIDLYLLKVLDADRLEAVTGVAFDTSAGTILIETSPLNGDGSYISHLLTVSRSGELLARIPLPDRGGRDGGLAWFPNALPESLLAARAGFLRDDSFRNYALYTPPAALFVNGSIGDNRRELSVSVGTPIEIFLDNYLSIPFALFAFPGEALPEDLSRFNLPISENDFGVAVFPMPFTDGDTSRTILVSNATGRPALGEGLFQTGPAPVSILLPNGVSQPRTVTIQAFFPARTQSAFLSNAIVLRVE